MSKSKRFFQPEVLARISKLELRARTVVEGFISAMQKSPYHGFSVEFAQHREYVPGDDLRHIDWRVFARADRFYIKQYEEETNFRAQILLDCSASMRYPEHADHDRLTKWEYASTVACSIAYLLTLQQDAPGMMLFDEEVRFQTPPRTSPSLLRKTIEQIERIEPGKSTRPTHVLRELAERFRQRGLILLISDLLTDINALIEGLRRFRYQGHEVIVMHVLDRDELEFPFTDHTLFEGLEDLDVELLTDPQSLRSSYLRAVNEFVSTVRRSCVDHQMDYVLLSTADPLDRALTGFLSRRMYVHRGA